MVSILLPIVGVALVFAVAIPLMVWLKRRMDRNREEGRPAWS